MLSDPATWTRAVWPNFKRGQPKEFTVFLNLCHSSLHTLILGGDVTLTHVTRLRKRCVALNRLVILKGLTFSSASFDVLPKVSHLSVCIYPHSLTEEIKPLTKQHPQLQSVELVSTASLYDYPTRYSPYNLWQECLSDWASNGFKPKNIVLFETKSHCGNTEKDYLCYHRQIQEFVTSLQHAASLRLFCRSRGPLGLTIEVPFLQVNVGPNSSPVDAGIATLPAHAGQFVLRLGRSLQGDLTARCVEQQPIMVPDSLPVPFSQCAPVLSCLDLSFLTLPVGALSCISQHCPQLRQLRLAQSSIPDLENGLNSLANECKWLCGIDLFCVADFPYSCLTVWKPISRVHSLKYLHVDGSVFMEIDKTEARKDKQGITSGPRFRLSHIPTIDLEVSQEVKTTIHQLTNVCGLHVRDFPHGDLNEQQLYAVLYVNLLSHVSCFHSLRYLKIDLTSLQYHNNPTGVNMHHEHHCNLAGMGELLQSCSYLQYLSITTYNVHLPEDPLLYSRLLQLQLKTFATDANERFFNALSSAQDLTVLCLQLRSFPRPAVIDILPKLPKLTAYHIVQFSTVRSHVPALFPVTARKLKVALKNHPNAPLDAFVVQGTKRCCHLNLSDLFIL